MSGGISANQWARKETKIFARGHGFAAIEQRAQVTRPEEARLEKQLGDRCGNTGVLVDLGVPVSVLWTNCYNEEELIEMKVSGKKYILCLFIVSEVIHFRGTAGKK